MEHPAAAERFIANRDQIRWHDTTIWGTRSKRDRASQSVPEWETLREIASRIKLHTMSRLDEYLEQFEAAALQLGVQVHWARDAAEHNAIVASILEQHSVRRVVKSKSMLTEECGLNPHLEQLGIEVTDTDLRREANLLEGHRALLALGFLFTLCQLVLVLTEIEEADHRRLRHRGDLDEVVSPLLRHLEGPRRGHHTQLGTLFIDHPDLWDPDHLVDAQISCYG